jgi:peptidoglycan/LPS O-acetylase OafA/YrhL
MHTRVKQNSVYRSDIDGIRAVAVLSVFLFHLNPDWLPGGFLGVDIFFVISGYLISGIILRENVNGSFSFIHFYARRVKRIFPALFVVLILSGIAAILLLTPETYVNYMKSSRYASAQLANFFFARDVGYFEEGFSEQALLHTWSLGVEEQFYLFWPLMIVLSFWFFTRYMPGTDRKDADPDAGHNTTGKVATVFIGLSLISFAACYYLAEEHLNLAFYMFYTRAWEFGLGGLLALNLIPQARTKLINNLAGVSGFLLLGYSFIFVSQEYLGTSYLRFGVILPVIGTVLIMYSNQQVSLTNKLLATRLPVSIGKISYSLYLYHLPIIIFYKIFTSKHDIGISEFLMITVITFILSVLSYRLVEQPLRQHPAPDRRVLLFGLLIIIVFSVVFKILEKSAEAPWRITTYTTEATNRNQQPRLPEGCRAEIRKNTHIVFCNVAGNGNAPVVALLGDSHGHRFVHSVVNWARQNSYNVISMNIPGCPMLLGDVHIKSKLDPDHETLCANALPLLESEILANQNVKLVLLAQRFELFYDGKTFDDTVRQISFIDTNGNTINDHTGYYRQQLSYTIQRFRAAGIQPVILKQVPLMANIKACNWEPLIYRILSKSRKCNFDTGFIDRWQLPAKLFIDRFITEHMLYSVDLVPYIDSPIQEGVSLYMDIDHLNEQGSQFIVPYFTKEMNQILEKIKDTWHPDTSEQGIPSR